MRERRRSPRYKADQDIYARIKSSIPVRIIDVSSNGMKVESSSAIPPLGSCDLWIPGDDGDVKLKVRVQRSRAQFVAGENGTNGLVYQSGLEILEIIKDYQQVFMIDAIKTEKGIPGSIYLFETSDFKETLHLSSLHDISFLTALELGKKLNVNIPDQIWIIAVEIIEDLVFSNNFTPVIQEKYLEIKNEVFDFIREKLAPKL